MRRSFFSHSFYFSFLGTLVATVRATDKDDPKEPYGEIEYSLVNTDTASAPMFRINKMTGKIYTVAHGLDRETKDTYNLMVEVSFHKFCRILTHFVT